MGHPAYFVFFAVWLVLSLVIMAFIGGHAFDYYRLRSRGLPTEGTAVAKAAHDGVTYSFTVNGIAYQGAGTAGFGTAPYGGISIGDKLPIYYLPKDPKINCLGSPEKLFSNELPPVLGAAIVFPAMIIASFVFRYKRC